MKNRYNLRPYRGGWYTGHTRLTYPYLTPEGNPDVKRPVWDSNDWSTITTNYGSDSFSFSGFGSNDPKKKRLPTPGYYDHQVETPFNGYASVTTMDPTSGRTTDYSRWFGGVPVSPTYPSGWSDGFSSVAYNNALEKLYDQLYDTQLNLATSLGEGRETAKMVQSALRSGARFITFCRTLKRRLRKEPFKVLAESFLAAKYGWMPFANDCYNLLHHSVSSPTEASVVGSNTVTRSLSQTQNDGHWVQTSQGVSQQKCRVCVTVTLGDYDTYNLSRVTQLSPLSLAYELTTLSFVLDYFVNIGQYLTLLERSYGSGLKFVSGYVTELAIYDCQNSLSGVGLKVENSNHNIFVAAATSSLYRVQKRRTVLATFPAPRLPPINVSLGASRIASLAALARTILFGKF